MNQKSFIFIGRSGSGKGTQVKLLAEYLKKVDPGREVLTIESGAEFREFIQGNSETQKLSKEAYVTDILQPEFLSVYLWINVLVKKYTGNQHLIFDGCPRRKHEAGVLDSIFGFYKREKPVVIYMDVEEDEVIERLLERHRMDDSKKDIQKRLAWFAGEVLPTLDFYKNNKDYVFLTINGNKSVEEIHADIVSKL